MRVVAGSLAKGGVLIALASCPLLIHVALSTDGWAGIASTSNAARFVDISLVAVPAALHSVIYTALLATFGMTLRPGRDALVTALARKLHGAIPDEMETYTRSVTWVWCCFFAAQLATSLALFLWASTAAWSLFVNVLDMPPRADVHGGAHLSHGPSARSAAVYDIRREAHDGLHQGYRPQACEFRLMAGNPLDVSR